ncbi:hypothetical protein Mx8p47 [Myxococcus phage Mx8]|uniref:p47 n=1 Tax=Myxococcus phage Mx8 TaxID=49964 RepID=Q94MS2_9CAUD|nr:hypothetical protein Mx8p47 [Myxococcus phage Mx8]AAK94382.1 p47 [Myxococcus phage Mx8]
MSGEVSLRESLAAAAEKHSAPTPAPTTPAAVATAAATAAPAQEATAPTPIATSAAKESPAAPTGGTEEPGATPAEAAGAKPSEAASTATAKPDEPAQSATPKQPEVRAPQSWRPEVREQWAKLPPEVQKEVTRREREVQTVLSEAAQHRKTAQSFEQVVSPYMGMIQAEGQDPVKAVAGLLQTAAALRTAPPAHKAQLVAQIVHGYGVPLEMLDAALAGQAPPAAEAQPQHFDPNQLLQQAEQRVMQRFAQQAQQGRMTEAQRSVEAFVSSGKAEFFDDVREDMQMLLQGAARRGVAMSLEDAYNRAVKMHPEVSKVLQQREQAAQANAAQASTQRARAAASSVKTAPAPTVAPKDTSVRGSLEAAWANSSGR